MESVLEMDAVRNFSSLNYLDSQRERLETIIGRDAVDFISDYVSLESEFTKLLQTTSRFNIESLSSSGIVNIVNIRRVNNIRFLNKFFESVNQKLPKEGIFIGRAETLMERRKRIYSKFPKIFSYPYYFLDFLVKRAFPKFNITRKLYFFLTQGRNRVLSRAEILGRLVSCGFEIVEETEINNLLYFVVKKVKDPVFDQNPSYGPFFKMRRYGQHGKIIGVYKFRTMHPYSEYLQEFMFKKYHLKDGGKFNDDFRITTWGKWMRKFWIDEFPMFINMFRGELKLVGVRPLSRQYLSLYEPELKERRFKHKPGLVPPFYVDMPKSLEEIMRSEERYLDSYEKHPIRTDIIYFFKAFYNIIVKKARSG